MKEGWEYKKLGEVSSFQNGFAFKSNLFRKEGCPIVRISNIQDEEVQTDDIVYFNKEDYPVNFDNYKIFPNDILIAMSGGTTGKLGINTTNTIFYQNQRVGVIREDKKSLNHRFLFYFLHTKSEESLKIAAGAAQPNLSTAQIKDFVIPVPPLSEQQSIVDYLDSAFAKIDAMKANAEKALNEAKALFQASLKEMLEPKDGWEEDALINVFKFIDYRGATPKKLQSGVPLVTAKNVKYGYIDYTIKDFISQEEYETRKGRGISRKGDLLFTTEAPLGNVAIADLEEYSAGQRLITLQQYDNSKYEFINEFYYYYILSSHFQNRIMELATGATAQGIKAKLLKTIIVPIPTLSEQQSIVSTLDSLKSKVDRLKANYNKISQECDALKQAILRQVFE